MRGWVGATLLFLYAPLLVLMVFSFNDSKRNAVWKGFTFKYYEKAFANSSLVEAMVNSLTIALLATVISVVLVAADAAARLIQVRAILRRETAILRRFHALPRLDPPGGAALN